MTVMDLFKNDPNGYYHFCMAAGQDEANKHMRKAGRTCWSMDEWNIAAKVANELLEKGRKQ